MNSARELKRAIYYHLIAGISLSVVLCVLLFASKYKYSLLKATADFGSIRMNVLKMEHVIRVMREKQSVAVSLLPADYSSRSHREILLLALERARSTVKEAVITVGNFQEEDDEITLPVVLEFNAHQYYEGLNAIGYLQNLRFPYFKTQNVSAKSHEEAHEIIWRIEGSFRIPAERITAIPDRRAAR